MVLDSQRSQRTSGSGYVSAGYRARIRRRRIVIAVTILPVALLAGWFFLPESTTTDTVDSLPAPGAVAIGDRAGGSSSAQSAARHDISAAGIGVAIAQQPDRRVQAASPAPASASNKQPAPADGASAQSAGSVVERSLAATAPSAEGQYESRAVAVNAPVTESLSDLSRSAVVTARTLQSQNKLVEARTALNDSLRTSTDPVEREAIRGDLAVLNERMIFSREVIPGDPHVDWYIIQSGDLLSKIARKNQVTDDLLAHVNRIANKNSIRAGDRIKVIKGPFHVVVDKSEFRLDLYLGQAPGDGLYVRSFRVGLGAEGGTPLGLFEVNDKLKNPEWVNPRTGEKVYADDPENPIGERWIGLKGLDETGATLRGYGIHGTIEPQTIGTEASMGCIRMNAGDVELLYSTVTSQVSRVKIEP